MSNQTKQRKSKMKTHPNHTALGERGAVAITTANRNHVRSWLSDLGVISSVYNALKLAQLNAAYNDLSDATVQNLLDSNKGRLASVISPGLPVPPVDPDAPDAATALADAIRAATASAAPPVDVAPIYDTIGKLDDSIHTALAAQEDRLATVEATGDAIRDLADALKGDKGGKARRATLVAKGSANPILKRFLPFYDPGQYNGGNLVSIESPAGFGKSHAVRELGESYDRFIEHGCSEDIEEISTLLGTVTPDGAGSFIVVDGLLTEAVRAGAAGETVLLLFDEHLRWSTRTQEFVLVTFTPVKLADGSEVFRLRTRRPDGGALEVIECPVENLHIIGASNLEARVPRGPYWDRWLHVRIDYDAELLQTVNQAILNGLGIPVSDGKLAERFTYLIGQTRKAAAAGQLQFPLSPRVLKRAALFAANGTEADAAKLASELAADHIQSWDADTGDRLEDGGVIKEIHEVLAAVAKAASETETAKSLEDGHGPRVETE